MFDTFHRLDFFFNPDGIFIYVPPVCLFVCFFLYFFLSLFVCLFVSFFLSLFVCLFVSFFLYFFLSFFVCLFLSFFLSLFVSFFFSLFVCFCLSRWFFVIFVVYPSLQLFLSCTNSDTRSGLEPLLRLQNHGGWWCRAWNHTGWIFLWDVLGQDGGLEY
jgi:predicted PurR-regulated permease PerM